jgi:hypothetical protein
MTVTKPVIAPKERSSKIVMIVTSLNPMGNLIRLAAGDFFVDTIFSLKNDDNVTSICAKCSFEQSFCQYFICIADTLFYREGLGIIMNKRINFEDNTFILNNRLRMIANTIILDVDPDLFLEKTIDDMDFIDTSMAVLVNSLAKNEKLIDRSALFYNLMETESKFMNILDTIAKSDGAISVSEFPIIIEKIEGFRTRSIGRQDVIKDAIDALDETPQDPNVVSSDELLELLRDF